MTTELGRYGIWRGKAGWNPELAAAVETLGFGTLWIGGSPDDDLRLVEELLDATSTVVVATGIVNMWVTEPEGLAAAYHRVARKHPDRFLLGVGIGHPEATKEYRSPFETIVDYLDRLDAADVPVSGRALAALGPKVLRVAGERTRGAHPYLTTPDHTRSARAVLGDGPLLAPEQKIVLDDDADRARATGRKTVGYYLGLRNYVSNLRKHGFTDDDLTGVGSDRLVDALAPHGTPAAVAAALTAHLDAGADHVAAQLLVADDGDPRPGWAALATELSLRP